jgi:hypothetical protein
MSDISSKHSENEFSYRRLWLVGLFVAGFSLSIYLFRSNLGRGPGFPLDDAWIHQTYARNLAERGEWAYFPGEPSAGSTSPLWSALIAAGYLIGAAPYLWSYLLGFFALASVTVVAALLVSKAARAADAELPLKLLWVIAAGFGLEWHLVWAAGSGMETLLSALTALIVLYMLFTPPAWLYVGVLIGVGIWIRPDSITLLGPALLVLVLSGSSWKLKLRHFGMFGGGFAAVFSLYLVFNRLLAGSWWPNTFYAKQAEYAIELRAALIDRVLEQGILPLTGAGAILLPGFLFILGSSVRRKSWASLASVLWSMGFLLLYALRLPVTYQYGRYVMPMMPVYFALGVAGMWAAMAHMPDRSLLRVIKRVWVLSGAIILVVFWLQGAEIYQRDVAFIEEEMVASAHWIAQNTPANTLVAAHDIGALGFFAQRRLVDLAGLVSPQVIPFIRDEAKLAKFLDETRADYLVTFPGWYPELVQQGEMIYETNGVAAPSMGGENMGVYRWRYTR